MRYPSLPGLLVFALWLPVTAAHAEDDDLKDLSTPVTRDWQVVRKDARHNIVTYSKIEDGTPIRSFKAEAIYDNSFDAAARHQLDVDNYKNWFMNMEESRLLKKVSDTEFYYYFKLKAPLGVPPRDDIIHVKIEPLTSASGSLVIHYHAVPEWASAKPGIIRMPAYEVTTRLTPLGSNRVKEVTEGYAQPGGIAPSWLINYLQRQMPYNNLLGRTRDIPRYERITTPFPFRYTD